MCVVVHSSILVSLARTADGRLGGETSAVHNLYARLYMLKLHTVVATSFFLRVGSLNVVAHRPPSFGTPIGMHHTAPLRHDRTHPQIHSTGTSKHEGMLAVLSFFSFSLAGVSSQQSVLETVCGSAFVGSRTPKTKKRSSFCTNGRS